MDSAASFCSKSPSVSIRFTICHEHACAACPMHFYYCIWRKQLYDIANIVSLFGDRTGPADKSKRTKCVHGSSCQIGFSTLFTIHL